MRDLYDRRFRDGSNRKVQIVITSALYKEIEKRAFEMDMSPSKYAALALVASMKQSKDDMERSATAWLI